MPSDVTAHFWRAAPRVAVASLSLAAATWTSACSNEGAGNGASSERDLAVAALDSAVEVVARGCGPQPSRGIGGVLDVSAIVTAAHIVAGTSSVDIVAGSGTVHAASVVFLDEVLDVALLRTDAPVGPSAELAEEQPERRAPGAIAVRSPGPATLAAEEITVVRSVTIRTTDIHRDAAVERAGYELQATVSPGDSGTLVHVDRGAIGIVWARSTESPDRAWAIALPNAVVEPSQRDTLVEPVDTGECV